MPVNTVATGGLPIVESTIGFGTPVSEAAPGRGVAVTKVISPALGLPVIFETIGIAPSLTLATFNGTPSAGIVMSNGNLTVTHGTTNNATGVQSSMTQTTGKYYFEITVQVGIGVGHAAGIKTYAGGAFVDASSFANGIGVVPSSATSIIWNNAVNTTKDLGVAAINDVFGYAIDFTGRLAWIRRNGGNWNADAAANPATGVNGLVVVAGAMSPYVRFTNTGATHAFTGNFGQSAFAFAAPSGFGNWGV